MSHDSHRAQNDAGKAASLSEAGIGKIYHARRLAEVPQGEVLVKWLTEYGKVDVRAGRGWNIIGSGAMAVDTTMLLARAVHLSGLRVRVASLTKLVNQLKEGGDLLPEYRECAALFVMNFFQIYGAAPVPYEGRELRIAEQFLIEERLSEGKAVFVLAAKGFTDPVFQQWWSPDLREMLGTTNRTLVVA